MSIRTQLLLAVAISLLSCSAAFSADTPRPADQSATLAHQIGRLEEKVDELKRANSAPFWIALGALVVSGLSVFVNYRNGQRALTQKAPEEQAKVLQDRLDRFYGPLRQMLKQSELLYWVLKCRQPDPENFRAVTHLLEGKNFTGNDKALMEEIIRIGGELRRSSRTHQGWSVLNYWKCLAAQRATTE